MASVLAVDTPLRTSVPLRVCTEPVISLIFLVEYPVTTRSFRLVSDGLSTMRRRPVLAFTGSCTSAKPIEEIYIVPLPVAAGRINSPRSLVCVPVGDRYKPVDEVVHLITTDTACNGLPVSSTTTPVIGSGATASTPVTTPGDTGGFGFITMVFSIKTYVRGLSLKQYCSTCSKSALCTSMLILPACCSSSGL